MVVEVIRFGDVSVVMVLVVCTELAISLPRKSTKCSIFQRHAKLSGLKLCGHGFVLQNDGPKHTSMLTGKYLQRKEDHGLVCWLLWIFLLSPLTSIQSNIYGNIWKGIRPSMQSLVKIPYSMPLMSAGTTWSQISSTNLLNLCQKEFQQLSKQKEDTQNINKTIAWARNCFPHYDVICCSTSIVLSITQHFLLYCMT